jgi:hypothetical protein
MTSSLPTRPILTRRTTSTTGSATADTNESTARCLVCFVVAVGETAWEEGRKPVLEEWEDHGEVRCYDCDEGFSCTPFGC